MIVKRRCHRGEDWNDAKQALKRTAASGKLRADFVESDLAVLIQLSGASARPLLGAVG